KRYRIKELLDRVESGLVSDLKRTIISKLGIDSSQFYRIINYKQSSRNEAKPSQLQIIAQELGCTIDDLMN
ncbi:MAG: hypothetical protein AAF806_19135, partial [Bacteroidota bacterium]